MKPFIFALIGFGTLALFNPDQGDFGGFIAERAQTAASDNARGSSGGLLGTPGPQVGTLTEVFANNAFERKSYVVFSTYSSSLNSGQDDWKFLGVGGQFFEMSRPQSLGD